jgi:Predicted dehydrogenases and related proteins
MYKIGIIGAGAIAGSHADAALKVSDVKLEAVADIQKDKAYLLAGKYGMTAYDDYEKMLCEQDLDIVIINLPHYLHKDATINILKKGINVLLEKPMALNAEECDEILEAANTNQVKLFIGHIQRYNDFNIKVRDIIQSGELGNLLMINEKRYVNYFSIDRPLWFLQKPKAGGGIVFNLGAHFFDKVQWTVGAKIRSVSAKTQYINDKYDVESSAQIFAVLDNGVSATCELNGASTVDEYIVEYIFSRGCVKVYPGEKVTVLSEKGTKEYKTCERDEFIKQLKDLTNCITGNSVPEIDGIYGRHIIKALNAVYESDQTGRTVEI